MFGQEITFFHVFITIMACIVCGAGCWYYNEKFHIEKDKYLGTGDWRTA